MFMSMQSSSHKREPSVKTRRNLTENLQELAETRKLAACHIIPAHGALHFCCFFIGFIKGNAKGVIDGRGLMSLEREFVSLER